MKMGPSTEYAEIDECMYPCRRILVDWIMLFAFPRLKHIPSINLTGFVKTAARNKWLARLGKGADREKAAREKVEEEMEALRKLPLEAL